MTKRGGRESSNLTPDEAFTLARDAALWSIERHGAHVLRVGGPEARRARVTLRRCASVPRARDLMARAVAAKLGAGYRPAARPAGWPAVARPLVASSAAHERALRGARDATSAFVAYGAWLRKHGDPRGALVAAAEAAEAGGVVASGCPTCDTNAAWFRRPSRARRDRPLWWPAAEAPRALDANGPHAELHREALGRHGRHVLGRCGGADGPLCLGWRLGFVEIVHLEHPGDGGDSEGARAALRRALRLPASRFARVVDVAAPAEWYGGDPDFADEAFVRDAFAGRAFSSVVSLSLGAWLRDYDDEVDLAQRGGWRRMAAPVLGEIGAASRAFPRLTHLSVAGRGIGLDGVDLGRLRHAAFQFGRPEEDALGVVTGAMWPRLRSLRLGFGDLARPERGSDIAARVAALADSRRAPELRHLRLERVPLTDELCDALGRSALAGSLVTLEIVRSEMTAEGVEALLRHRHRMPRLRALDVACNALTDDAIAALAAGFGRRVEVLGGEQLAAYEYDAASERESAREETLRALNSRPSRPEPPGWPAGDEDEGDELEGLLDAAVVLTSLRGDGEAHEEPDDDDGLDGEAAAPPNDADGAGRDDLDFADSWPMAAVDYDASSVDDDDEPPLSSRDRKRERHPISQRPPADDQT